MLEYVRGKINAHEEVGALLSPVELLAVTAYLRRKLVDSPDRNEVKADRIYRRYGKAVNLAMAAAVL